MSTAETVEQVIRKYLACRCQGRSYSAPSAACISTDPSVGVNQLYPNVFPDPGRAVQKDVAQGATHRWPSLTWCQHLLPVRYSKPCRPSQNLFLLGQQKIESTGEAMANTTLLLHLRPLTPGFTHKCIGRLASHCRCPRLPGNVHQSDVPSFLERAFTPVGHETHGSGWVGYCCTPESRSRLVSFTVWSSVA